jgi:hypothetical protein
MLILQGAFGFYVTVIILFTHFAFLPVWAFSYYYKYYKSKITVGDCSYYF